VFQSSDRPVTADALVEVVPLQPEQAAKPSLFYLGAWYSVGRFPKSWLRFTNRTNALAFFKKIPTLAALPAVAVCEALTR
jgi:hypothetical protein